MTSWPDSITFCSLLVIQKCIKFQFQTLCKFCLLIVHHSRESMNWNLDCLAWDGVRGSPGCKTPSPICPRPGFSLSSVGIRKKGKERGSRSRLSVGCSASPVSPECACQYPKSTSLGAQVKIIQRDLPIGRFISSWTSPTHALSYLSNITQVMMHSLGGGGAGRGVVQQGGSRIFAFHMFPCSKEFLTPRPCHIRVGKITVPLSPLPHGQPALPGFHLLCSGRNG